MPIKYRVAAGVVLGAVVAILTPALTDTTVLSIALRALLFVIAALAILAMTSPRTWVRRLTGLALTAPIAALFLHYTLPQHDIVQVVGTENRRIDFGENSWFWASRDSGTAEASNRDVFFIQTRRADGSTMVYRNEDTGWDWPPYFKFDSSNLQAEAAAAISTFESPRFYAITHYGWRIRWMTVFPNAISIRPVDGPDAFILPWVSALILAALAGTLLGLNAVWRIVRRRYLQPHLDRARDLADDGVGAVSSAGEAVSGHARMRWLSISRWLDTWKGKPRL